MTIYLSNGAKLNDKVLGFCVSFKNPIDCLFETGNMVRSWGIGPTVCRERFLPLPGSGPIPALL
jgi:hypothetical protein